MWSWFEYRAAYDSEVRVELPLIPSARAAPPSGPSLFQSSLWAHKQCLLFCQRALTQKRTLSGSGAPEVGDLRLLEDGSERGGALVSDVVPIETASEGQDGNGEIVACQWALT